MASRAEPSGLGCVVGSVTASTLGSVGDVVDHGLDGGGPVAVGHPAVVGVEDQLGGGPGRRGEPLLQQVPGLL